MFISHTGEVLPSGFLPLTAGNVRSDSVGDIYRNSELFLELRDTDNLRGKCGDCEFREICGGSRARAYALSGDIFAADPSCVYVPGASAKRQLKCTNDRACRYQIKDDQPAAADDKWLRMTHSHRRTSSTLLASACEMAHIATYLDERGQPRLAAVARLIKIADSSSAKGLLW